MRENGARFLAVSLDETTLEQNLSPGRQGRITAGAYPSDPNPSDPKRPGSRPQADDLAELPVYETARALETA